MFVFEKKLACHPVQGRCPDKKATGNRPKKLALRFGSNQLKTTENYYKKATTDKFNLPLIVYIFSNQSLKSVPSLNTQ
jgi:hypothetical protein